MYNFLLFPKAGFKPPDLMTTQFKYTRYQKHNRGLQLSMQNMHKAKPCFFNCLFTTSSTDQ